MVELGFEPRPSTRLQNPCYSTLLPSPVLIACSSNSHFLCNSNELAMLPGGILSRNLFDHPACWLLPFYRSQDSTLRSDLPGKRRRVLAGNREHSQIINEGAGYRGVGSVTETSKGQ